VFVSFCFKSRSKGEEEVFFQTREYRREKAFQYNIETLSSPMYEFRLRFEKWGDLSLNPLPCTLTNDPWESLYRALQQELFSWFPSQTFSVHI
jgi:hypothetical protein